MREIDGVKVAFVEYESYFSGLHTPSMFSTCKATGADVVMLLAPGKTEADLSDEYIREILGIVPEQGERLLAAETENKRLRKELAAAANWGQTAPPNPEGSGSPEVKS